jgi:hypothetical protein
MRKLMWIGIFATLCAIMLLGSRQVQACGGFFCQNVPINQNAERIIFLMNEKEQQVSAIVGINYVGEAKDFSWVVPVPNKPTVEVVEQFTVNAIDQATSVIIQAPRNYCQDIVPFGGGRGGGGGGGGELGSVGPYDYAIIQNDSSVALIKWLRENGFRVPKEIEPVIDVYVREKQYFVAFKLRQDVGTDSIQPVKLTYHSTYASIPLRLTAVAAVDDMPVLVWIFGSTQYIPQNYAHPTIDFSGWRAPGRMANSDYGLPISDLYSSRVLYNGALKDLQTKYKGQAFVTEMASPVSLFTQKDRRQLSGRSDELDNLLDKHTYVTRLRAQLSANEMTKDPVFVAQPGLADVSNVIDLGEKPEIDPLVFWGCSSRTAIPDTVRASIPPGRSHINELKLDVAHPANWKLSTFTWPGETPRKVWAVSSKPVTAEIVKDFFAGRTTVPLLLGFPVVAADRDSYIYTVFTDSYQKQFLRELGLEPNPANLAKITNGKQATVYFRHEIGYLPTNESPLGLFIGVLAQPGYWTVNGKMYEAMLAYARTYQKYANPNFQHTLVINHSYHAAIGIPYPQGWIEKTNDGDVTLSLEKPTDPKHVPMFRLSFFTDIFEGDTSPEKQKRLDALYGPIDWEAMAQLKYCYDDTQRVLKKVPFQYAGNKGLMVIAYHGLAAVYAPEGEYEQYQETLNIILDAYLAGENCDN